MSNITPPSANAVDETKKTTSKTISKKKPKRKLFVSNNNGTGKETPTKITKQNKKLINSKKSPRQQRISCKAVATSSSTSISTDDDNDEEEDDDEEEEESQIDISVEANIQAVANKNNLSSEVIEKILKKVVGNDHVLALVKIKEEQMEKNEKLQKENTSANQDSINMSVSTQNSVDSSNITVNDDDEINQTIQNIKLTRAKARALNQNPLPIPPLKNPTPPPEIARLINEDLCSDEEDEEYQPGEEDIPSEDDLNTSISDIDSQPRTPLNSLNLTSDCEGTPPPAKYTKDGLFKIPRDRSDSVTSISEQDYIIAKQTRSKVSLAATPIEIIESNFHPPDDITIDDNEHEDLFVDYNYLAFLNDIFNPSETTTNPEATCIEEDDEDDEDFHVVADKLPTDKEEMSNARIPKKEYQDLLNELFGDLPDLSAFDCMETIVAGDVTNNNNETNQQQQSLSTPPQPSHGKTISNTSIINGSMSSQILSSPITPIASSQLLSSRNSNINSTLQQTSVEYSINPITFSPTTVCLPSAITTPLQTVPPTLAPSLVPPVLQSPSVNIVDSSIVIPITHINPYHGAVVTSNGMIQLPQFQQILISVPTVDLIKSQQEQQTQPQVNNLQPQSMNEEANQLEPSVDSITKITTDNLQTKPNTTKLVPKKKKYNFRISKSHNHFIPFKDEPPVNCKIYENVNGFTRWQRDLLNQQLQMHTQLLTQHYLQSYAHSHPRIWKFANVFKDLLNDLYQKTTGTCIKVINLKMAIDLIEEWENDLTYKTEENIDYIAHFEGEIKRAKDTRTPLKPTFHEKFLNKIINSKIFIYPKLLPLIPLRFDFRSSQIYFHPLEDFLIAFGLEKYYIELQNQRIAFKLKSKKKITLDQVCKEIGRKLLTARQTNRLCKCPIYTHVMQRRQSRSVFNPIQYFYKYKKAPQFLHVLETVIDKNNMMAPINQVNISQMSEIWIKHIRRFKALAIDKKLNPRDYLPIQAVAPRIRDNLLPIQINNKSQALLSPSQSSLDTSTREIQTAAAAAPSSVLTFPHSSSQQEQSNNEENYQTIIIEYVSENGIVESEQLCVIIDANLPQQNIATIVEQPITDSCGDVLLNENQESLVDEQKLIKKPIQLQTKAQRLIYIKKINVTISTFSKDNQQLELFFITKKQPILLKIFKFIKSIEIYLNLLKTTKMDNLIDDKCTIVDSGGSGGGVVDDPSQLTTTSTKSTSPSSSSSSLNDQQPDTTNSSVATPQTPANIGSTASVTVATTGNSISSTKRNQKCVRSVDMTRLMLLPETNNDESKEKDALFAQNFMDKVQETYLAENNEEKILEFQQILKLFDPQKERAPALYLKMEKLFMPDHPELAELFLAFLIPGEAAEIGKFMEHFMLTNMSTFLQKLGIFYNKQPAQLRKILACLKELSNVENLQIQQIKEKIIPLLRGNPLLIDWFQQCFLINTTPTQATTGNNNSNSSNNNNNAGNDQDNDTNFSNNNINNNNIPDNEYESLNFHKASEQVDEIDVYEQIPQSEICPDPVDSPCQIRYMNGRIYYGNRILLPAQLSFLMTNFVLSSTNSTVAVSPLSPPPQQSLSLPTPIIPSSSQTQSQSLIPQHKNCDLSSEELKSKAPSSLPQSAKLPHQPSPSLSSTAAATTTTTTTTTTTVIDNNNESITLTLNPPMVTIPVHSQYRCVHAIKQFGDIKVKEQQRAYFENEFNAGVGGNFDETERITTTTAATSCVNDDDSRVNHEISIKLEDGNNSSTNANNLAATDSEITSTASLLPSASLSLNCCDGMTLKAHGIRLNPIAHHTELIKTSDLLDLLKPSDPPTLEIESEKEQLKNSPKKQSQNYRAALNNTSTTTTTATTNISSFGQKSPGSSSSNNNNKRTESQTTMSTSAVATSTMSPTVSKAIVTAKKLKTVINNSNGNNKQRRRNNQQPTTQKKQKLIYRKRRRRQRRQRNSSISSDSSAVSLEPPLKIAKTNNSTKLITSSSSSSSPSTSSSEDEHENENDLTEMPVQQIKNDSVNESNSNSENTSGENNCDEQPTLSWSRDEDKIVLEEIKNGFTSEFELVDNLYANQLSHRTINEIHNRFKFLMDIIASL